MKKFKLTKETITHFGRTLYRIEALIDFSTVIKGEKGGYIEKESNLGHHEDAWISGNARVFGNAEVYSVPFQPPVCRCGVINSSGCCG